MTHRIRLLSISAISMMFVSLAHAQVDVEAHGDIDPSSEPFETSPPTELGTDAVPLETPTFQAADALREESAATLPPPRLVPFLDPRTEMQWAQREARQARQEDRIGPMAVTISGAVGTALGALLIVASYVDIDADTGSPMQPLLVTGTIVFSAGIALLLGGLYWWMNTEEEPVLGALLREPSLIRF